MKIGKKLTLLQATTTSYIFSLPTKDNKMAGRRTSAATEIRAPVQRHENNA
jgi:hypothetical protein